MDKVKDAVKTTRIVVVPPFQTIHIQELSHVRRHDKRVNIMTDAPKNCCSKAVITIPGYSYSHQHSRRVSTVIQNLTSRHVVIKPKTTIAAISAANVVPSMLAPWVIIKLDSAESSDSALSEIKSYSHQSVSRVNQSYHLSNRRNCLVR